MVSQTLEYALRAVVTIAQQGGHPCTAQKLASITQVPGPYLSKLLQDLVCAKIVASKRGLHGGFSLRNGPAELTVWDVAEAIDPLPRIRECPLALRTHRGTLCPLHRRLDQALAFVEQSLRGTRISELLAQPGSVTPLCEEPPPAIIALLPAAPARTAEPAATPPDRTAHPSVKKSVGKKSVGKTIPRGG